MYKLIAIDLDGTLLNSYGEWAIKERIFHAPTLAEGNTYYVIDGEKVIYQANDNSYYGKGKITNVSYSIVSENNLTRIDCFIECEIELI